VRKRGRVVAAKSTMSNWTSIAIGDLNDAMHASVIAATQTLGVTGGENPIPGLTQEVVSRIRAMMSVGNVLDADPTKVPNSLKGLAVRMIIRALKIRVMIDLTRDEETQQKEDASYLNRIGDLKLRFDKPDNPAGAAEMQSVTPSPGIPERRREFTRSTEDGV
jgi:hypothetical protein